MKLKLSLILKGFIIGIGKVIPGVSGSLIAISLGLYEKCIDCISNFFKNLKENIVFLGFISIGIVVAISIGSKFIIFFINNYFIPTMFLFIGLIAGGIPSILKKKYKKDFINISLFIMSFLFIILIKLSKSSIDFEPNSSSFALFKIGLIGFIDAMTMIIPGISGTAVFMLLGCYNFVLSLFSNILNIENIIGNFKYVFSFAIGLFMGIILISKLMNFCFKKYKERIYMVILGLSLSSIFVIFIETISQVKNINDILMGIILLTIGYKVALHFER